MTEEEIAKKEKELAEIEAKKKAENPLEEAKEINKEKARLLKEDTELQERKEKLECHS